MMKKQKVSYIGEWKDNVPNGKGKEQWDTGLYYEGEYANGMK